MAKQSVVLAVGAAVLGFILAALAATPVRAEPAPLVVTQQSVYRHGILLVVDAVVQNVSGQTVDGGFVPVEFTDFFDDLLSAQQATLWTPRLLPGQVATVLAATPWNDNIRGIRYRFTWSDGLVQRQTVVTVPVS